MMLASKQLRGRVKRVSGITLIELIIVIALMMLMIGLVGPLTFKIVDKAHAQTEYINLQNSIKRLSYNAFTSAAEYKLLFQGGQLKILKNGKYFLNTSFDYLTFSNQSIDLNSRGYPYPEILRVNFPNKQREINLFRLIEGTNGKITQ